MYRLFVYHDETENVVDVILSEDSPTDADKNVDVLDQVPILNRTFNELITFIVDKSKNNEQHDQHIQTLTDLARTAFELGQKYAKARMTT